MDCVWPIWCFGEIVWGSDLFSFVLLGVFFVLLVRPISPLCPLAIVLLWFDSLLRRMVVGLLCPFLSSVVFLPPRSLRCYPPALLSFELCYRSIHTIFEFRKREHPSVRQPKIGVPSDITFVAAATNPFHHDRPGPWPTRRRIGGRLC